MKSMGFLLVIGLLASPGLSQTSKPDSQTQQQILDELRAIHRDLRASTTLQLLLAELQITETSLDRATQKVFSIQFRSIVHIACRFHLYRGHSQCWVPQCRLQGHIITHQPQRVVF